MTWKFKTLDGIDRELEVMIPINGEEPVLVQFHLGELDTDDDDIGQSMFQSEYYGKLFAEYTWQPPKKEPVKKQVIKKKPAKRTQKRKTKK